MSMLLMNPPTEGEISKKIAEVKKYSDNQKTEYRRLARKTAEVHGLPRPNTIEDAVRVMAESYGKDPKRTSIEVQSYEGKLKPVEIRGIVGMQDVKLVGDMKDSIFYSNVQPAAEGTEMANPVNNPPMQEEVGKALIAMANAPVVAYISNKAEEFMVEQFQKYEFEKPEKWGHVSGTVAGLGFSVAETWAANQFEVTEKHSSGFMISGAVIAGIRLLAVFLPDWYKKAKSERQQLAEDLTIQQLEKLEKQRSQMAEYMTVQKMRELEQERRVEARKQAQIEQQEQPARQAPRPRHHMGQLSRRKLPFQSR